ncbi:MAG: energy-coupling factor transporter ATPase [Ruminococcaceae bacterium]|nr:energy-coupling factor transporter ATPase [Oscillospiraceae bacterium]
MAINISNLNYIYMPGSPFEKHALRDINLTIHDGEFVGIIGHTGSGKSTLVQHLNGLLMPSSGSITVGDIEVTAKNADLKQLRQKVGLVFQYPEHQLFEETVYKDIAYGPKNMKLSPEEIDERVREAMNYVGLGEKYCERSPFELSGGQKRRVAIAGVLAMRPDVLILDEPAAGLDPAGREEILTQIRALYLAKKMTVLFVSHSMEDVARIAGRIIVMNNGSVAMDGSPADIFSRAKELRTMGLDVPQITQLVEELRARGLNINDSIYTLERAKATLLMMLSEKEKKNKEGKTC